MVDLSKICNSWLPMSIKWYCMQVNNVLKDCLSISISISKSRWSLFQILYKHYATQLEGRTALGFTTFEHVWNVGMNGMDTKTHPLGKDWNQEEAQPCQICLDMLYSSQGLSTKRSLNNAWQENLQLWIQIELAAVHVLPIWKVSEAGASSCSNQMR